MDFIALDFETATADRNTPCEIGLTFVKNNELIETKSWLIKPKSYPRFDNFNISIHGITPAMVAHELEFSELWSEIRPLISNQLVIAHNAGFDFSVLRKTLETYNLAFPTLNYACSYVFSKKVWEGLPAYDLKTLCRINNIEFKHHRAASDSRACAELTIKAFKITDTKSIEEFPEKLKTTIGKLWTGGYNPSESKRISQYINPANIIGDASKHNLESVFYGRTVVFTGVLSSMARVQAHQVVADIGGVISNGVNKNTDFLVVGQQDYRVVGEDGMSSKQEKAIELINKGSSLEVISEQDFLRNI